MHSRPTSLRETALTEWSACRWCDTVGWRRSMALVIAPTVNPPLALPSVPTTLKQSGHKSSSEDTPLGTQAGLGYVCVCLASCLTAAFVLPFFFHRVFWFIDGHLWV